MKNFLRLLLFGFIASLSQIPLAGATSSLNVLLDPVSFGNSGGVKFKVFPSGEIANPNPPPKAEFGYETIDNSYSIFLDPDTVVANPKFNSFSFDLMVRASADGSSFYVFNVLADPSGNFPDSLSDVTIKVLVPSREPSIGIIKVPLHSPGYTQALDQVSDPNQPFVNVNLSNNSPPAFILRDTLGYLPIQITHFDVRPSCSQCWVQESLSDSVVQVSAGSEVSYPLKLRPRLVGALLATAFILKKDSPHDVIYADATYSVGQGGLSRHKSLLLKIKFSPSFWELTLAVLLGALVGMLLRRIFDPDHSAFSRKLLFQSLFLAAVAEFLAVVAASFDSKLVLIGFDMDPRQFIPAMILAAITAGGPIVAKWIAKANSPNALAGGGN